MTDWDQVNEWERQWWGDCVNTFAEETKQITYAHRMGLQNVSDGAHWPYYDLVGRSVLDIGGGPTSILLKCHNGNRRVVVDPCRYPDWVRTRYEVAGIEYHVEAGENLDQLTALDGAEFDEAWIYNVLQHTEDPKRIIDHARSLARSVRIFEWVNIPPHPGHPQMLLEPVLNEWLGGTGSVEDFRGRPENGCNQVAYYGHFPCR